MNEKKMEKTRETGDEEMITRTSEKKKRRGRKMTID